MGILNVTPDSFSDGGQHAQLDRAVQHALEMQQRGAAIIDVGGESTRPGAAEVTEQQELDRVIPVIEKLLGLLEIPISIDTSKPVVMQAAMAAGASMVNDVMALQQPGALEVVAAADPSIAVCLMHMQGLPRTMQQAPSYKDVTTEVLDFLLQRVAKCELAGISRDRIVLDPGFGFGKSLQHNLTLLAGLQRFSSSRLPLLVGISRKSMIGAILGDVPVDQRLFGSIAAAVMAFERGASILRVHDVKQTVEALKIADAVIKISTEGSE